MMTICVDVIALKKLWLIVNWKQSKNYLLLQVLIEMYLLRFYQIKRLRLHKQ